MKCYYEELCVERDANESEIKIAYRKMALKWHPDKNLNCLEEAKERFQLIQQAYEVLSDPQERAWYDNHREQILRGKNSDYKECCLEVFQYFTVSCFKGYEDDEKGFYAVYRDVFEKIAAEDAEFIDDEEELLNIPKFGDSKSSYEEVVGPFYAYWGAYCTKKTYTWLCPYDIKEIKDRRILREIEKDMKKMVQKAKRERNEEVRNLVSFIRKRDKRVQAYKKVLEERVAFNRQKQEQNRLCQIRRRQQEVEEMRQNSKIAAIHNDDYEEQLQQLELDYSTDEEGYYEEEIDIEIVNESNEEVIATDEDYDEYEDEDDDIIDLYCVACNKEFKTENTFNTHQRSKKHQDNLKKHKRLRLEEEESYQNEANTKLTQEEGCLKSKAEDNNTVDELPNKIKSSKAKNKKPKKHIILHAETETDDEEDILNNIIKPVFNLDVSDEGSNNDDDWKTSNKKANKKSKLKSKSNKTTIIENSIAKKPIEAEDQAESSEEEIEFPRFTWDLDDDVIQHMCAICGTIFESRNKLFVHLKLTDHSVYIPKAMPINYESKSKKTKSKRKSLSLRLKY